MKLNKLKTVFNPGSVLFLFLTLSFLFDFIDKVYIYNDINFIKFNRVLKFIFLLYALSVSVMYFKFFVKTIRFVLITLLLLTIIYLLKVGNYNVYKMEFLRYAFLLASFPLIYYVISNGNFKFTTKLYQLFKYIIVINTVLILIGLVCDIQVFKTYKANRFGFNGMLLSQGFTPFFYLSAIVLFWYMKDKKMLIVTILISFISGVKGVYLAEFIALTLIVFYDKNLSRAFKIKGILVLFFCFTTVTLVILNISPFKELIKSDRFLTAIFSYRIEYSKELISSITKDNFNYLIGATGIEKVRLEMQIIDIFLFFGIIGFLVYTYFIYGIYKIIKKKYLAVILLLTALITSIFIGNFFCIPMSSLLIVITMLCLSIDEDFIKIKPIAY